MHRETSGGVKPDFSCCVSTPGSCHFTNIHASLAFISRIFYLFVWFLSKIHFLVNLFKPADGLHPPLQHDCFWASTISDCCLYSIHTWYFHSLSCLNSCPFIQAILSWAGQWAIQLTRSLGSTLNRPVGNWGPVGRLLTLATWLSAALCAYAHWGAERKEWYLLGSALCGVTLVILDIPQASIFFFGLIFYWKAVGNLAF